MVGLLLAGCGDGQEAAPDGAAAPASTPASASASSQPTTSEPTILDPGPTPPTPTASSNRPPSPGTVITTGNSDFGEMLFDARDQAIYLFEPESDGTPACYGECEAAWPPVLTKGTPKADGGADPDLLGSVQRRDGSRQVTYNGWPLYFYAHEGPGEVLCHDVVLNGGLWLALGPDGDALPS
jgi:predicted lipoprotein with Yx(FWY)xxD motif